ncbi:transcriptional regulator [Metarhizium rileyi]|uniref:Transcriptional regulator n=1 Tax=Metarhizium rileyi (strain RCEF 4871) TaxID=1649241 RepID=A0A167FKE6_METRR|nr:transcriptional regulator [Metarhizium rileyi RCEF 4871]TWU78269.1 hypothetical protein ED733_008237 [Metarhizium rileyi]
MAPSTDQLEEALISGTCQVFNAAPDATTVNKVRKLVEESLDLEEGFFTSEDWKQKSKGLIKQYVDKLLDGWVPEPKLDSESKNKAKQKPSEEAPSSPRRHKRTAQNGKPATQSTQPQGIDEETQSKPKKAASRRKSGTIDSTTEANNDPKPSQPKKRKQQSSGALAKVQEKSQSADDEDDSKDDAMSSIEVEISNSTINEEEEYSDVIDEAPKPKRKKKERKDSSSKPPSKHKVKKTTESAPDSPDEAEIKKLQTQLVKCGVRKLWHNELKKCGGDARAKIRHLKKMLAEVGMDGRFSETKAREIREARELLAEAEAAQEMNRLWGMGTGGRASRSKNKSTKLEESVENEAEAEAVGGDDGTDDDDDEEGGTSFAARRRRAQADLAFLGDDSESDE